MNEIPAPLLAERADTAPVRIPKLAPSRGGFIAGVVTGGALLALDVALLIGAMSWT